MTTPTPERIAGLDCGDNSCEYATNRGGMRTNGGCRCELHLRGNFSTTDIEMRLIKRALRAVGLKIVRTEQ